MEARFRNPRELSVAVPLFLLFLWRVSGGICPPGAHTLRYNLFVSSSSPEESRQPQLCQEESQQSQFPILVWTLKDSWQPQFPILVYVNDELFLRYAGDCRRAGSWGPRIKGHARAQIWTGETGDLREKEEQLRRMLAEVMKQKGQDRGFHTLQATFGCELQENSTKGFWLLGYNGQDLLSFDQEIPGWTVSGPFTYQTKMSWETRGPTADLVKTFLDDICPAQLQRYLTFLPDTGTPMVKVTYRNYPVGRITLTCRAFNLYPPVATLTWLQNGEPVQQNTFQPGAILPSGDGTYQTWLSIWVLPGQEPQFTCHLRHCSHNITVPAGHAAKYFQDTHSSVINKDIRDAPNSAVAPVASALSMVVVTTVVFTRA